MPIHLGNVSLRPIKTLDESQLSADKSKAFVIEEVASTLAAKASTGKGVTVTSKIENG